MDVIACDDTRTTKPFSRTTASPPARRGTSNMSSRRRQVIALLREGHPRRPVSDACTPVVADPGAFLVGEAHRAASALPRFPARMPRRRRSEPAGSPRGRFLVPLPARIGAARRKALEALDVPWPVIFYEAPLRILETLNDLAARF